MKYSGFIFGLSSSVGSIYNIVTEDKKSYIWKANVIAETSDKMLTINFNWDGCPFKAVLSLLKDDYYTGDMLMHEEKYGKLFLWQYIKGNEIILKGDYDEIDTGDYTCFIELRPLKT